MHKKAEAYKEYGDAAIMDIVAATLPKVVAEAARPTVAGTPARELLAAAVRRHRPGGRR